MQIKQLLTSLHPKIHEMAFMSELTSGKFQREEILRSEVVELYPSSTSEASPVSTLLFNHRRAPNAQIDTECDGKSGNQDGCRWQSISHDGGMTFNHFHAMPHLPDPSNKGGICRYKEKRALLLINC